MKNKNKVTGGVRLQIILEAVNDIESFISSVSSERSQENKE